MGDKYKCLRPLIKNLNGVIKEQKDCELEVEKLINQVTEVRKKQAILHNRLLESIKQLGEKKTNIDLRWGIKYHEIHPYLECFFFLFNSSRLEPVGSSPNELQSTNNGKNPGVSGSIKGSLQNNLSADKLDSIIDPNDIDQIIKKTQKEIAQNECTERLERRTPQRSKYISPLDCMSRSV